MHYQVFVQSYSEQRVAYIVGLPNLMVEGRTEEEAIAKAKAALKSQLATGKFVTIEINLAKQPLPKSIGIGASHRGDLSKRVDELMWQEL